MKSIRFLIILLSLFIFGVSCTRKLEPISVLASPELRDIQPLIRIFEKENHTTVTMDFKRPPEITAELESGHIGYTAVWTAHRLWLELGDTHAAVTDTFSTMYTPVVFAVKPDKAKALFVSDNISIQKIMQAVREGKLHYLMPSATQTSSGALAYFGFLRALWDGPGTISQMQPGALRKNPYASDITALLAGTARTAGDARWLTQLMETGNYDAVFSFESCILHENKRIENSGGQAMRIFYPENATMIADNPLGLIRGASRGEKTTYGRLKNFLLSEKIQDQLPEYGRRPLSGQFPEDDKTSLFNTAWGVKKNYPGFTRELPGREFISEALHLYQKKFKKPSISIYCIDFSYRFLNNERRKDLQSGLKTLFNQQQAGKMYAERGSRDITVIMPFSFVVLDVYTAFGNNQNKLNSLIGNLLKLQPNGNKDVFTPIITALDLLSSSTFYNGKVLSDYLPAVYLISGGEALQGRTFTHLQNAWDSYNIDVGVFPIELTPAVSDYQFQQISNLTHGRIFHGDKSLADILRQASAYN